AACGTRAVAARWRVACPPATRGAPAPSPRRLPSPEAPPPGNARLAPGWRERLDGHRGTGQADVPARGLLRDRHRLGGCPPAPPQPPAPAVGWGAFVVGGVADRADAAVLLFHGDLCCLTASAGSMSSTIVVAPAGHRARIPRALKPTGPQPL